jgi:hypothetical protein
MSGHNVSCPQMKRAPYMAEINWFPGTVGTHFAGLPLTDGKWVEDRDFHGNLVGWLEMFPRPRWPLVFGT